jgi:hypothetical protein
MSKWLAPWMPAQTDQITMSRVFVKEVEPETIDLPDRTIDAAADHMTCRAYRPLAHRGGPSGSGCTTAVFNFDQIGDWQASSAMARTLPSAPS